MLSLPIMAQVAEEENLGIKAVDFDDNLEDDEEGSPWYWHWTLIDQKIAIYNYLELLYFIYKEKSN